MGSTVPPGLLNPRLVTTADPFGYQTAWFAVRSEEINTVTKAIELERAEQVNWQYGASTHRDSPRWDW